MVNRFKLQLALVFFSFHHIAHADVVAFSTRTTETSGELTFLNSSYLLGILYFNTTGLSGNRITKVTIESLGNIQYSTLTAQLTKNGIFVAQDNIFSSYAPGSQIDLQNISLANLDSLSSYEFRIFGNITGGTYTGIVRGLSSGVNTSLNDWFSTPYQTGADPLSHGLGITVYAAVPEPSQIQLIITLFVLLFFILIFKFLLNKTILNPTSNFPNNIVEI